MKRILILAYDFPPYVSVGGLRPYSWYKYLKEYDVYPIVITRQWENKYGNHLDYIAPSSSRETIIEANQYGQIIRTSYKPNLANKIMLKYGDSRFKFIRKAISAYYEYMQFVFHIGPKSRLYSAAKEYLKTNKVDAIIATGDPYVLFKYAKDLSAKYNIPWIADYRDPWSQKSIFTANFFIETWNTYLEKKIVSSAIQITTVALFFKQQIETKMENKKIFVLPNGYDPEMEEQIKSIDQQGNNFTIAYAGHIYEWHPIDSFLKGLLKFIEGSNIQDISVNFYGINNADDLRDKIKNKYGALKKHIHIHPRTPNNLLLQQLASQHLMLLFNYYSFSGTKIYDYLLLRRAILFCYSNDENANELKNRFFLYRDDLSERERVQEKIIAETNSGYIVKNEAHLQEILTQLYNEFQKNGYVACNSTGVEKYSRKHQVKQLAEIIHKL